MKSAGNTGVDAPSPKSPDRQVAGCAVQAGDCNHKRKTGYKSLPMQTIVLHVLMARDRRLTS